MTEPTQAQIDAARNVLSDTHALYGTIPDETMRAALTAAAEVGEPNVTVTEEIAKMKLSDHFKWIDYWSAAHMVNVDAIQSLEDMREARRFCSCMSHGLFWDISDEQFWSALQAFRYGGSRCKTDGKR